MQPGEQGLYPRIVFPAPVVRPSALMLSLVLVPPLPPLPLTPAPRRCPDIAVKLRHLSFPSSSGRDRMLLPRLVRTKRPRWVRRAPRQFSQDRAHSVRRSGRFRPPVVGDRSLLGVSPGQLGASIDISPPWADPPSNRHSAKSDTSGPGRSAYFEAQVVHPGIPPILVIAPRQSAAAPQSARAALLPRLHLPAYRASASVHFSSPSVIVACS